MTHVGIEYCVPCGLLEHAIETQRGLLEEFGQQLDGIQLTPGHGGVFQVRVDGDVVWAKEFQGPEPDHETIADAVAECVAPTA